MNEQLELREVVERIATEIGVVDHEILAKSARAVALSRRDIKRLCKDCGAAIAAGNSPLASSLMLIAIEHLHAGALSYAYLGEPLRPSAYRGKAHNLAGALRFASESLGPYLDGDVELRLQTLTTYARVAVQVEKRERRLLHRMGQVPDCFYWLLATAEDAFIHYDERLRAFAEFGPIQPTPEATAATVSYLLNLAARVDRLPSRWFALKSRKAQKPPRSLRSVLQEGYDLLHVRELEPYVVNFEYRCVASPHGGVDVIPPDEEIGRGLESGEIDTMLALQRSTEDERASLRELAEGLADRYAERLFEWVGTGGKESLRTKFELDMLLALDHAILRTEALFREEHHNILTVSRELFVPVDELVDHEVAASLPIRTLSKFTRFFFLVWLARRRMMLRALAAQQQGRYWRSLLVGFPRDSTEELVTGISWWTAEAAHGFFSLVCSSPDTGRVDLQYTPMLRVSAPADGSGSEVYCVLPTVMAYSGGIRNALLKSKTRPSSDGSDDRLVRALGSALGSHFERVRSEWTYRHDGRSGEIDVLFLCGSTLFALECKRTLWPSGGYEMRTQWDYLQKGADQLDRFSSAWGDPEFRKKVSGSLGWDLSVVRRVITGLVTTSRYMAGFTFRGHPVRVAGQLLNFLDEAKMLIGVEDAASEFDLRSGRPINEATLSEYFSHGWRLSDCMRSALRPYALRFRVGANDIRWHRYSLDVASLLREIRDAFSVDGEAGA